jgi:hypothetical protein
MRSRIWSMVAGLALLTVLAVAGAVSLTSTPAARAGEPDGRASAKSQGRRLEGTWRVQVTLRDCGTGAELRTFPAMLTFAQGGALVETTTGFGPAARGPGHGFWRYTGGNTYTAVSEAFLFNPDGTWNGTQRLTQTIEIGDDRDELTATASNEIFNPDGSVRLTGCATAVAHRFE